MELTPDAVARGAAQALADELSEPELPEKVDEVLGRIVSDDVRLDGESVISLAALVVAAAQLAVGIYFGLTGKGSKTRVEMEDELGRRLKVQTGAPPDKIEKIVHHTSKALFTDHQ